MYDNIFFYSVNIYSIYVVVHIIMFTFSFILQVSGHDRKSFLQNVHISTPGAIPLSIVKSIIPHITTIRYSWLLW